MKDRLNKMKGILEAQVKTEVRQSMTVTGSILRRRCARRWQMRFATGTMVRPTTFR